MLKLILILVYVMLFAVLLITVRALRNLISSNGIRNMIYSLITVSGLVTVDQLLKLLVVYNYPECRGAIRNYYTFELFGIRIFSLTHIRNDGAGWSILGGQTVLLSSFTLIVVIGIVIYMIIRRKMLKSSEWISLDLIIAGGLGNLIDRLRMLIEGTDKFSGVIDYIKLDFINFPVFNFADCCVVAGAILFCAVMIFDEIKEEKDKKHRKKLSEAAASEENITEQSDEPL